MSKTTPVPAFTIEGDTVHIPAWEVSLPLLPLMTPAEARWVSRLAHCGEFAAYEAAMLCKAEIFGTRCTTSRMYWEDGEVVDGFTIRLRDNTIALLIERVYGGVCDYSARHLDGVFSRDVIERGTATMAELLPLVMRLAGESEVQP